MSSSGRLLTTYFTGRDAWEQRRKATCSRSHRKWQKWASNVAWWQSECSASCIVWLSRVGLITSVLDIWGAGLLDLKRRWLWRVGQGGKDSWTVDSVSAVLLEFLEAWPGGVVRAVPEAQGSSRVMGQRTMRQWWWSFILSNGWPL